MARQVAIGIQDFEKIRENRYFYIDKTDFIREWWMGGDDVTLITRPRRFGKTLTMSMVEQFFSVDCAGRAELFEGLSIWDQKELRSLQGTYPVIALSFASIKEMNFANARQKICQLITNLYMRYSFLMEEDFLRNRDREFFGRVSADMDEGTATMALYQLSDYLYRYYGKKVILLLDEYDTPMQEAYIDGYWDELNGFLRSLFNAAFKTNPYMERALLTGITRVSKESIFSDLNNLEVVTTTSAKYETAFGFTQQEVREALEEYGLSDTLPTVKKWYDGFTFGSRTDIYNPWSIINYLDAQKPTAYWANTSSNSLVSKLIREGNRDIKEAFAQLLQGESLFTELDEQIVYSQLEENEHAIWSLLLASGYLKVKGIKTVTSQWGEWRQEYELELTNFEVLLMFRKMVQGWFGRSTADYNDFIRALLLGDVDAMNAYMNRVAQQMFSYFDTGKGASGEEQPERFYHGFVLGLIVDLTGRYRITSNRESGFGRYDVCLEPLRPEDDAILLEFKVFRPQKEKSLEDTVRGALRQIEEKGYEAELSARGIGKGRRIRKYGFAFEGKKVLIGGEDGDNCI
ncbi:MAG: AAA family ATPase [Eubacteriales bacterium]|nr:AAA family ATPase [Eubacteriales bacterium]